MDTVKRKFLPLAKIKANQQNPRVISESKLKKLINSLLVFPKMMSLRPITIDDNGYVLGGNMRLTALGRIAQMTLEELLAHLESLPEYNELPDGGHAVIEFWEKFLSKPQAEVQYASKMTESVTFRYANGKEETQPFSEVVEQARLYILTQHGSFEHFAEWGLIA